MRGIIAAGLTAAACTAAPASSSALPATGKLPEATTYTTIKALPRDPAPASVPDGIVVRPHRATLIHRRPGGRAVAVLPTTQLSGPTWVPVVETVPGWHRVLLPSRPNRSTGWIRAAGLETAHSPYLIRLTLRTRKLTVYKAGRALATWRVAVGAPRTPTPTGRTFLLANLATSRSAAGVILPTGVHSATLDTFGGGPGTVAFHGWPSSKVFGRAVSHGCVRVPRAALKALSKVPLGSPILITSATS